MQTSFFTHSGNHQSENQDSIVITAKAVIIADGMGGLSNAREAAEFTTAKTTEYLDAAFQKASFNRSIIQQIFTFVNKDLLAKFSGSGTTLSILIAHKETVWCANVGDSETYKIKNRKILKISEDQNLTARTGLSLHKKILINHVGKPQMLPACIQSFPLTKGSTYILCTDGTTDIIDLHQLLDGNLKNSSKKICELIQETARKADPKDNYTAVVVQF